MAVSRSISRRTVAVLRILLPIAAGAALLWWVIPAVTGAAWSSVGALLTGISLAQVAALTLLWAAGLLAHSFVLTGSLPGLSRRQALTLNLTGSAVANVVPAGGALAVATNLRMVRSWRLGDAAFVAYTVVTNLWDVMAKLVVPLVALVALLVAGLAVTPAMQVSAMVGVVVLATVLALAVWGLTSKRAGRRAARAVTRLAVRVLSPARARRFHGLEEAVDQARTRAASVVRRRWAQLSAAMALYVLLQFMLLLACLYVVGVSAAWVVVLAAFAAERTLTLAPVTPGGSGLADAAAIGTLVVFGVDPLGAAAGVLLYRVFTFVLEIPVGGLWLSAWLTLHTRHARSPA